MRISEYSSIFYMTLISVYGLSLSVGNGMPATGTDSPSIFVLGDTSTMIWERSWKGQFDLYHPISLTLAFDGQALKGTYAFQENGPYFLLEGTINKGEWVLLEIDTEGRVSGSLVLYPQGKNLSGQWWTVDFSRNAPVWLKPAEIILIKEFTPACVYYSGISGEGNACDFMLQKESPGQCSGYFFRPEMLRVVKAYGECADPICDRLAFTSETDEIWSAELITSAKGKPRLVVRNAGEDQIYILTEHFRAPLEVRHRASYTGTVDAVFPSGIDQGLDRWVRKEAGSWIERSWNILDHEGISEISVQSRYVHALSLWTDIGLVKAGVISGLISFLDPDTGIYRRKSFTYNINASHWLPEEEIFRDSEDVDELFREVVHTVRRVAHSDKLTEEYNNWVETVEFKHQFFRIDGLVRTTDFHPMFGDLEAVVSYMQLKSGIRYKPLRKSLVN